MGELPLISARNSVRCLGAVLCIVAARLPAQISITEITTNSVNLSNQTINGDSFSRLTTSITSFKDSAGNIYDANTTAGSAYVRRNTTAGNPNNSSAWYDQGTNTDFEAPYATTYSSLLLGNNLLRGSDNTFSNDAGVAGGNIERLDFLFGTSGITASLSTSFAVFDRGSVGQHDNVKIAVITGWDSVNNRPTSYGGTLFEVTPSSYGTTNLTADFTYNLFRYNTGDNLGSPYWTSNTETGTQGIGGAVISMADLGIAAGTTIYGYSLMAADVTNGGSMANLVDWTNTTYYSTSTSGATGAGGIDLSAVNGVLFNRKVPEPSTYGAILLSATAALLGWRRRRRISAPAA